MMKDNNIKTKSYIYMLSNFFRVIMSILLNAILSRILTPYDFGIVAIVSVFSIFFITISDIGIGPAIVQIKELSREDTDNIFSMTIYIALISSVLFAIASLPIAHFYNNDDLVPLFFILSSSVFFGVSNMVPAGIINRDKHFIFIAIRNIVVFLISSVIAIIFAFEGFGVYSIVVQTIISSILTFIADYIYTKPSFIICIRINSLKKIFKFSIFQFFFNLICYASRNIDDMLTGKYIGTSELGFYNKAYTLMLYPVENLSGVFSPIIHPVLSDYQNKPDVIYEKYVKIVRILFLLGILVSSLCFFNSNEMITIVCGPNWEKTIVCFKIMSVAILPQMLNSCAGAIFQSLGNTKLLFINGCINIFVSFVLILIAVFCFKDINYISFAIVLTYYFHFLAAHFMLIVWGFGKNFIKFIFELKKEILILFIVFSFGLLFVFNFSNVFISLFVKSCFILIIFVLMLFISGDYKHIKLFLFNDK